MITDADIERSVDWLRDNAEEAAKAKAEKAYRDKFSNTLKADLMRESNEETAVAREQHALSHPEYKKHLQGYKQAVFNDARMQYLREAAQTKIDAWRTFEASKRTF